MKSNKRNRKTRSDQKLATNRSDQKLATKKTRQKKQKSSDACKRINSGGIQSDCGDIYSKQGSSLGDINTDHPELRLKNNYTRYDEDRTHSKKIHTEICKQYQKTVHRSYCKRRFIEADIDVFDALLGRKGLYADHMPASDPKLRNVLGHLTIDQLHQLHLRTKFDPELKVFLITFVDDAHMVNERGGDFEVYKFKQKVQSAIREHTNLSALGVLEVQAIVNYPKAQKGKFLSLHAHAVCWGYDPDDPEKLIEHAKGFKSSLTKLPIHSTPIVNVEGSFSRIARYIAKPPYQGKEVDYRKFETSEACLFPARRMEQYHNLRLFEYCAKVPTEQTIFGVREGSMFRDNIVARLKHWHSRRKGTEVKVSTILYEQFEKFFSDNKRFKNYRPFTVNWLKPSRRKKTKK